MNDIFIKRSSLPVYSSQKISNGSNHDLFLKAFFETDLVCIITMLDALLLFKGGPTISAVEQTLPEDLIYISYMGIKTLNQFFNYDLISTQSILNAEGMRLQLFHLVVFWIYYWKSHVSSSINLDNLFHEVLLLLGYTSLSDTRGQEMLRFGQGTAIITVLADLDFHYYLDPRYIYLLLILTLRLKEILFPTLISAIFQDELNISILEEDLSLEFLKEFIENRPLELKLDPRFALENRIPSHFLAEIITRH